MLYKSLTLFKLDKISPTLIELMIEMKNIKFKIAILSYLEHDVFSFPDDENCDGDLLTLSILVTVCLENAYFLGLRGNIALPCCM